MNGRKHKLTHRTPSEGRGHWPEATGAWCSCCGAPLPAREPGQRGAPAQYCNPDTGRNCREWAKALTKLLSLSEGIAAAVPAEHVRRVRLKLGGQIVATGTDIRTAEIG